MWARRVHGRAMWVCAWACQMGTNASLIQRGRIRSYAPGSTYIVSGHFEGPTMAQLKKNLIRTKGSLEMLPPDKLKPWKCSGFSKQPNQGAQIGYMKITEVDNIFWLLYSTVMLTFIKNKLGYILGDFFPNSSGVDVMITIFCDFRPFSTKKIGVFLKNQWYDQFFFKI
jgi:hypothetical protein